MHALAQGVPDVPVASHCEGNFYHEKLNGSGSGKLQAKLKKQFQLV